MKGWYKDSYRHSLAAKGVRTSLKAKMSFQPIDEERLRLINLAILASPEREDELVAEGLRAERELIAKMEEDFTKWMPEIAKGDFIVEMNGGDYFIFRLVGVSATGPVWRSTMPGLEDVPILLPEVEGIIKSLYPMGIYDIKATEARADFAGKLTVKDYFRKVYGDETIYNLAKERYAKLGLTDEQIDNLIMDDERKQDEELKQTLRKGGSFDEMRVAEGFLSHKDDVLRDYWEERKRKAMRDLDNLKMQDRLNLYKDEGEDSVFFRAGDKGDLSNKERLELYKEREPKIGIDLPEFTEVGKKPIFTSTTTLDVKEGEYD